MRTFASIRAVSPPTVPSCPLGSGLSLWWAWLWWYKTSLVLLWLQSTGELSPGEGAHADHRLLTVTPPSRSLTIVLPEPRGNPADFIPWLYSLTASVLPGLLRQADPQHVIEYSLALITVLNEVSAYEQKRIPQGCSLSGQKPRTSDQSSSPMSLNANAYPS